MSVRKIIMAVIVVAAYILLSHAALMMDDAFNIWRQLAVWILLAPLAGFACWGTAATLRASGRGHIMQLAGTGLVAMAVIGLALDFYSVLLTRLDVIYLIQHLTVNTTLCWFFLQTLCAGRTPVITAIARAIHSDMPDSIVRYTRKVTMAWAIFFAMQVLCSLLIFIWASIHTWSVFANILHWPMIILMFMAEYICRKRCNPDFRHATMRQSVLAYLDSRKKT